MKTPLLYGLLMAIAGALLTYALYFAGFHDTPEKLQAARWPSGLIGIAITIVILLLAMRARRAEYVPPDEWGYGSAFVTGLMVAVFGCLFAAVFQYVYMAFINRQFSDLLLQLAQQQMPPTQFEHSEGVLRKIYSPIGMTIFQALGGMFFSVIMSLIIAIFVRKPLASGVTEIAEPPPVG